MLYKIRHNQMHHLNLAIPVPYVPVWVTHGALTVHRYTYASTRCRASQYKSTFIPLAVFLWNDLADSVFDGVGWRVSKSGPLHFSLA